MWCPHTNYLLVKCWTVFIGVGVLCNEYVTSMNRTVWCFLTVVVFLFLFSVAIYVNYIGILFWIYGYACLYGFHQGLFFCTKGRCCTSILNSCSPFFIYCNISIMLFILPCLCPGFRMCRYCALCHAVVCQIEFGMTAVWWTYYWGQCQP